jgi:hypothetical protein
MKNGTTNKSFGYAGWIRRNADLNGIFGYEHHIVLGNVIPGAITGVDGKRFEILGC